MYNIKASSTTEANSTPISENELFVSSQDMNSLPTEFPIVDMNDIHISNELLVQSVDNLATTDAIIPANTLEINPQNAGIIISQTDQMAGNTLIHATAHSVPSSTLVESHIALPTDVIMTDQASNVEKNKDADMIVHQESMKLNETSPTIMARVSTPIIQVNTSSIDSNQVIKGQASVLPGKIVNQPVQIQPIKLNTSGSQPVFVNQMIGSNVQSLQNSLGNISYILPTNSINKQGVVNKATPLNVVGTNIVSNIANSNQTSNATLINNAGNILNSNNTNIKLIQTSQGQQLVFSPVKTTTIAKNVNSANNQVTIKPSTSKMVLNQDMPKATAANLPSTSQQQQLIILSPVKANQTVASKPAFIPSIKILPNSKLPNIAPATAKRMIAPAPVTKSIAISSIGNAKPIQTIVHSNNKNVHYISFVPVSSANQLNTQSKLIPANTKYVPLKPMIASKASSSNQTVKPNMVQLGQKVLINPSSIKISTTVASTSPSTSTTVISQNQAKRNQPTSIWMLPKQQLIKVNENSSPSGVQLQSKPSAKFIPIAPNPNQANTIPEVQKISISTTPITKGSNSDNFEESRRKPCNCTRSQCLKLYCDCFANGEFCNNCNCVSCCNNLEHEETRKKAIHLCLERNPNAFHPKIGQTHQGDVERRHTKGCCCKRSGCLKNYCECYEAKILCSDKCKCVGCKNFEESTERKTLMHLADAAEVRSAQQSVASKMHIWGPDLKPKLPVKVKSDCHPFNIFTMDILETTASCLLAQAEEGEFENYNEENIESLILEQFGECLSQILNLAGSGVTEDSVDGNSDDDEHLNDFEMFERI